MLIKFQTVAIRKVNEPFDISTHKSASLMALGFSILRLTGWQLRRLQLAAKDHARIAVTGQLIAFAPLFSGISHLLAVCHLRVVNLSILFGRAACHFASSRCSLASSRIRYNGEHRPFARVCQLYWSSN